jgi:hypothetical protein
MKLHNFKAKKQRAKDDQIKRFKSMFSRGVIAKIEKF